MEANPVNRKSSRRERQLEHNRLRAKEVQREFFANWFPHYYKPIRDIQDYGQCGVCYGWADDTRHY